MCNKVKNQRIWLMLLSLDLFKYFSDRNDRRGPIARLIAPATEAAVLLQRSADHLQLLNVELWGVQCVSCLGSFGYPDLRNVCAPGGCWPSSAPGKKRRRWSGACRKNSRKMDRTATFRAINNRAPGFADRDLYPFVTEVATGLCVANGVTPAVAGKILIDLKDQDGRFIIQEFIKIATTTPGRGWIDYAGSIRSQSRSKTNALIERWHLLRGRRRL